MNQTEYCPVCEALHGIPQPLHLADSDGLPEDALRCEDCYAPFLLWEGALHIILRDPGTPADPQEKLYLVPVEAYLSADDPTMKEGGVYNSSVISYTSLMNNDTKNTTPAANPKRSQKTNKKEKNMPKQNATTAVNDTPVVREKLEGSLTPADLAAEFNLTPPRFRAVLRALTNEGILPERAKRSRWLWHPDHDGAELETIRNHMKAQNEKPAAEAPAEEPAPKKPAKK